MENPIAVKIEALESEQAALEIRLWDLQIANQRIRPMVEADWFAGGVKTERARKFDARAREIEALIKKIEALGARIESLKKIDVANRCIGINTVRMLKAAAHGANYRDVEWQTQAIRNAGYKMDAALKAVLEVC